jgi:PAS domain S-box-containing protein
MASRVAAVLVEDDATAQTEAHSHPVAAPDGEVEPLKAQVAALERSLETYRRAFQVCPVGIAISSGDGRFIDINGSGLRLFGKAHGDVIGRTSIELAVLEDSQEHQGLAARVREQGSVRDERRVVRAQSGELRDVTLQVDLIELRSEPAFVSTFLDVTDQRRATDMLAKSEAQYRQIVEMAREGICISNPEGRYTFVNGRFAELLGYEPDQMIGMHASDVLNAEARAYGAQLFERRRQGIAEGGEIKVKHRDGRDLWVKFESSPIMEVGGRYAGSLAMVLDITERRLAEDRLRKSEAQLRDAQALAHVGSWEWELKTDTVTRSRELCRIFGMTEEEFGVSPASSYERVHPGDREPLRAEVERATRTQRPWAVDYRIVRPDGVRFLHARGEVACDETGAAVRMFGTAQDVTEQREIEARLVLADRMASVGTLAAGVAHEINNPLSYVLSNLELLAEELKQLATCGPAALYRELAELTGDARDGAERVRKIVRGLKTFSRADEDCRVLLDVTKVLDLAINMAFNEVRHRARLVKDYQRTPLVEADEARLGQVFVNLLINAAQAVPEGHADTNEIRLVTGADAVGRAFVEVRDSGPGMSKEVLRRIFDPFFTTKPVGLGTGLGLSICHGIVTALGGEITAESEPGRGSVFRVVLPPAPHGSPRPEGISAPSAAPAVGQRGRVLVVDDEPAVGSALSRVLKEHDITVLTNADEARNRIASGERFDIILCDLMMPRMTGMDLHAELARTSPDQADRMIFVTGGAFTPRARAFLDQVPNERIDKPFDPKNVRALVQRFLR